MRITKTPLTGLIIIEPEVFSDSRGYFYETFQNERYRELGLPPFVQDNFSRSKKNVIRGLHYQLPYEQGKLVGVTHGKVWDVAVDLRVKSPTYKQWFSLILSDENHKQMYIPVGFAHGFCVLSDEADFYYKCTNFYSAETEQGIFWNDQELNIPWPIKEPLLSSKDSKHPYLNNIAHEKLFT